MLTCKNAVVISSGCLQYTHCAVLYFLPCMVRWKTVTPTCMVRLCCTYNLMNYECGHAPSSFTTSIHEPDCGVVLMPHSTLCGHAPGLRGAGAWTSRGPLLCTGIIHCNTSTGTRRRTGPCPALIVLGLQPPMPFLMKILAIASSGVKNLKFLQQRGSCLVPQKTQQVDSQSFTASTPPLQKIPAFAFAAVPTSLDVSLLAVGVSLLVHHQCKLEAAPAPRAPFWSAPAAPSHFRGVAMHQTQQRDFEGRSAL